jgi:hypothetical protein
LQPVIVMCLDFHPHLIILGSYLILVFQPITTLNNQQLPPSTKQISTDHIFNQPKLKPRCRTLSMPREPGLKDCLVRY